ncbi:MAG: phosphate ABC transporter permease subunit PstC [Erythrobacter sp.]|uniref:phosphate ABC transporter permease subunit PstC n=1 Tax=Erythrobacter sp. TaxID=1042 RepID=UPI0032647BF1
MTASFLLVLGLALAGWLSARSRAWALRASSGSRLASLPNYHGWYVGLWIFVPTIIFVLVWNAISPNLVLQSVLASPAADGLPSLDSARLDALREARAVANGAIASTTNPDALSMIAPFSDALSQYRWIGIALTVTIAGAAGAWSYLRVKPEFGARTRVERVIMTLLILASLVAVFSTFGILASLIFETFRFFEMVSPIDFLFGTFWSPDPMANAENPDPTRYGAIPLFWGTLLIGAVIAMIVAIPIGMMSAIYLTQYAHPRFRAWAKPALEILAGVPTVVYGYFAALTVAPMIRDLAMSVGIANASSESALAAGLVMGVMIIPFVSSMADDSIAAVPQAMRDGSLAMGATTSETIKQVLVPAALPGIVGGVMLAISRAIGETMIVVMAASTAANLSANPLDSMTTVTVQIVAMLTGEGSFDHPATLSAFALGFILFLVTLGLNFVALSVVKRYREAYE